MRGKIRETVNNSPLGLGYIILYNILVIFIISSSTSIYNVLCRADFRLTPEEQDIAYEFKAHVMQKIHSQNQNIKKELDLHEKKVDLKKCQQVHKKQIEDQSKSKTSLVNLMNMYEKKAHQGGWVKIMAHIVKTNSKFLSCTVIYP